VADIFDFGKNAKIEDVEKLIAMSGKNIANNGIKAVTKEIKKLGVNRKQIITRRLRPTI